MKLTVGNRLEKENLKESKKCENMAEQKRYIEKLR
jgi:hypothetical protein